MIQGLARDDFGSIDATERQLLPERADIFGKRLHLFRG
jgi:hypothetical protein